MSVTTTQALKRNPAPWRDAGFIGTVGNFGVVDARGAVVATVNEGLGGIVSAAPDMLEALRTTAGNIRSLGPARALGEYREWLAVVDAAIAKAVPDV